MEYSISQGDISIKVKKKGAELRSLQYKGIEFMWEADPQYWAKTSPILFPFVGGLKNDTYTFEGKEYVGTKHGFARDHDFELYDQSEGSLTFLFTSSAETLAHYPFPFALYLSYQLSETGVNLVYKVVNQGEQVMYFSLGAHPAFATPTSEEIAFEDYFIEFEKEEKSQSFLLEGLLVGKEKREILDGKILPLSQDTFAQDALMFENLNSQTLSLKCKKSSREVVVDYRGFPYIAFWNKPGANYICIEPWFGIADSVDSHGNLKEKVGIQRLSPGEEFLAKIQISLKL